MTPRIRSFAPATPLAARKTQSLEAPRVFREFVETLQKLDVAPKRARASAPRKRSGMSSGQGRARSKRTKA